MLSQIEMQFLQALEAAEGRIRDIGGTLGLEARQSDELAMGLIARSLVEIKSLSGIVGLSQAGREALSGQGGAPVAGPGQALEVLEALDLTGLEPAARADARADMAALKAQLGRSSPLPGVIEALAGALAGNLAETTGAEQALAALRSLAAG